MFTRAFAPILALFLTATPVAFGATGLLTTHPDHRTGGTEERVQIPPPRHERLRRPVNPPASSILLMEEERRGLGDFRLVKPLTQECRSSRFMQRTDRRYIAVIQGRTYGAGLGGHKSLLDPRGLGMPGMVYLFKNQDTSRCEVYLLGAPTG